VNYTILSRPPQAIQPHHLSQLLENTRVLNCNSLVALHQPDYRTPTILLERQLAPESKVSSRYMRGIIAKQGIASLKSEHRVPYPSNGPWLYRDLFDFGRHMPRLHCPVRTTDFQAHPASYWHQSDSHHKAGFRDLSGSIKLQSVRPVFNGQYSSVFRGSLGDKLVRAFFLLICKSLITRQVAVKVIKEIRGAKTHTMQRVSFPHPSIVVANKLYLETRTRMDRLGKSGASQCRPALWVR